MTNAAGSARSADGTQADMSSPITKALHLLDVVASFERPVRFSEIQQVAGLSKGTLHRLLKQLEAERMLAFDEAAQRYRLGLRLIRLAHGAWENASLVEVARPTIDRLAEKLGLTIRLGCMEGEHVLYLDKRMVKSSVRMFSSPGRVAPLYCTGLGKAMLAHVPANERDRIFERLSLAPFTENTICSRDELLQELTITRKRGFAIDNEEHEVSIICIAVPILARDGTLTGAISATSTVYQHGQEDLKDCLDDMKLAAAEIAQNAEVQFLTRRRLIDQ